ncbi:MAG: acyltransferase [Muribaculum sp.]|nr:acyltransferase [Muribaculum sp.]
MNDKQPAQLRGVDIMKYIMAIGVIVIHVGAVFDGDATFPDAVVWWMRSAVPYFFIVSGYLFARRNQGWGSTSFYREKAQHVYRIFGCWLLVYIPIAIITYWEQDYTVAQAIKSYVVGIFTYGQCPGAPLWYLYALGGFMVTMYLACRFNIPKLYIVGWFILIYLIDYCVSEGIIGTEQLGIKWFYLLTRRFFGGGIYILSGMAIYYWRSYSVRPINMLITATVSIVCFYFNTPFWELMSGATFFILALNIMLPENRVWLYLRHQSMWIYYTHMLSIFIIVQYAIYSDTTLTVGGTLITAILITLIITNLTVMLKRRFPAIGYLIS